MSDDPVPRLLHGLETRFLLITWSWCNSLAEESFAAQAGRAPRGEKEKKLIQAHGAAMCKRLLAEFFFGWLLMTERYAKEFDKGVVRRARLDETMLWGGGQLLYDLFATGCVRGPYGLPWDNAENFREYVLKPAVRLMRGYERDPKAIFPPEAKKLLSLRGLTFDF
jgi:hypothetical protein